MTDLLRISEAAARLGVHPQTLRVWALEGRIAAVKVNKRGDRRFDPTVIETFLADLNGGEPPRPTRELVHAAYVRVSGRGDQMSSLAAQSQELTEAVGGAPVRVFKDVASGLSEKRRGLHAALQAAQRGEYTDLWVTHEDRLARFGVEWITMLFADRGVAVHVLHPTKSGSVEAELVADFVALVASFAGRLYGQRSAEAKRRLLAKVTE